MDPSARDESIDVKGLRIRLRKMSEAELLRFGQAARYMCSDKCPPPNFVTQLKEARAEWKRRNPTLPLSESI